jgi:anti-sigma B factor antagonist
MEGACRGTRVPSRRRAGRLDHARGVSPGKPANFRPPSANGGAFARLVGQGPERKATLLVFAARTASPFTTSPHEAHPFPMDAYRRIQTGKTGDIHIVVFKDKKILDDTVLDEIKTEITQLIGKAAGPDMLLDFANVEFMSSAMLGLLGSLHRKILTGKGRLKMCNIRPEIFQVFKLTNLDKLFSIHKDAPTALATFT